MRVRFFHKFSLYQEVIRAKYQQNSMGCFSPSRLFSNAWHIFLTIWDVSAQADCSVMLGTYSSPYYSSHGCHYHYFCFTTFIITINVIIISILIIATITTATTNLYYYYHYFYYYHSYFYYYHCFYCYSYYYCFCDWSYKL